MRKFLLQNIAVVSVLWLAALVAGCIVAISYANHLVAGMFIGFLVADLLALRVLATHLLEIKFSFGRGDYSLTYFNSTNQVVWVWGFPKLNKSGIEDALIGDDSFEIRVNGFHYAG